MKQKGTQIKIFYCKNKYSNLLISAQKRTFITFIFYMWKKIYKAFRQIFLCFCFTIEEIVSQCYQKIGQQNSMVFPYQLMFLKMYCYFWRRKPKPTISKRTVSFQTCLNTLIINIYKCKNHCKIAYIIKSLLILKISHKAYLINLKAVIYLLYKVF